MMSSMDFAPSSRSRLPWPARGNRNCLRRRIPLPRAKAAAAGLDWTFAPMVDLARDPRWGRIAEGIWRRSVARSARRGCQRARISRRKYRRDEPDRGVPETLRGLRRGGGRAGLQYDGNILTSPLRNFYLPQFKAGVGRGAWTVMSAFNELSGMPASGNHHTLTDILRGEWKFSGFVVSDWTSVAELIPHGVAADDAGAARLALTAGVDMEMRFPGHTSAPWRSRSRQGKFPKRS